MSHSDMYSAPKMEEARIPVFISKSVIDKINEVNFKDPYHETGGFFIGSTGVDPVTGSRCAFVRRVYFEDHVGTGSNFEFTMDYKIRAVRYVREHCPGERIMGNIHFHAQFPAFWSGVDYAMMREARDNSFYLVVSNKYGTWESIFKDDSFRFYPCDIHIADDELNENMFRKSVTHTEGELSAGGGSVRTDNFCKQINYSPRQLGEFNKRVLHPVENIHKKVAVVGCGNIGNLICQDLMSSGVIMDIWLVDMDTCEYWNLPRVSMLTDQSLRKPKSPELARAMAERSPYPLNVTAVNASIYDLGWGFLKDFDLIISPVDSAAVRQYIDRGCRIYHIPHLTCGTGTIGTEFTGNVLYFPEDAAVDLEYVWGTGYRNSLEKHRSCADLEPEVQPQVMNFSSEIAGITVDLAIKSLMGVIKDKKTVWKYVLNAVGCGYERDRGALRTFRYTSYPNKAESELYSLYDPEKEIVKVEFDRSRPKKELWQKFFDLFGEDIKSYRLDLEWGLNVPVAYLGDDPRGRIEIMDDGGVDPVLKRLPPSHVYPVVGDMGRYLVELRFTDPVPDTEEK